MLGKKGAIGTEPPLRGGLSIGNVALAFNPLMGLLVTETVCCEGISPTTFS
jgi:hypothetical protein